MSATLDIKDPVASQAIEWMVLLRSGEVSAREIAEFEGWRKADPRHEAACQRLERALGKMTACPVDAAARKTLLKPVGRRRAMLGLLGLAGAAWTTQRLLADDAPAQWLADLKTGTGKRHRLALAEDGHLLLNACSAINIDQAAGHTKIELISGEVMLREVRGRIQVQAAEGLVAARGADFAVRRSAQGLRVAVLRGELALQPRVGRGQRVRAGELALMDARSTQLLDGRSAEAATAWVDGVLQVRDQPLAEVVAALRDYRPGLIHIDEAAAALRVSGSFPLDDTDRSLRAIAQTLPVRIRMTTPYWVTIEAA